MTVCALMFAGAGLALAITPSKRVADQHEKVDLERLIPAEFAGWRIDPSVAPVTLSPDVAAKIQKIYTQTLSRTYVSGTGERIMLSIAYGAEQDEGLQVHVPEVCYPAQGFRLVSQRLAQLHNRFAEISGKQLLTVMGARHEPITYWMTVGGQITTVGLQWKLAQLRYGLTGSIPDGMLVRVSNISNDLEGSYRLHERFIEDLLGALPPDKRQRLVGARNGAGEPL
jgi:EpsI family protein